ncbi:putative ArsR family transcriptional regulator [Deinobacterium chartae]|uniref:Putative ArsR family transcriptional regulator n=1 Tax=Deinobacterium chartae TaxID=521158 RepID=A0A841HXM0_9DEIO|nr:helix-turn-helix domain-containing protein [Deinobacterium chartae]MBB6096658.1 putative ArsR family transcriptional regulator [Deinobacterium chartae]
MIFNPPVDTKQSRPNNRKANEQKVFDLLQQRDWSETEMARELTLSPTQARSMLSSLVEQGLARQFHTGDGHVVYGAARSGLEIVEPGELTPDAERVMAYLRGRPETLSGITTQLRLSRERVSAALALLEANDELELSFVGNLVVFRARGWTREALVG